MNPWAMKAIYEKLVFRATFHGEHMELKQGTRTTIYVAFTTNGIDVQMRIEKIDLTYERYFDFFKDWRELNMIDKSKIVKDGRQP